MPTADGDYTGEATFEAKQDTGSDQKTNNGHQYEKLKQTGTLIGMQAT